MSKLFDRSEVGAAAGRVDSVRRSLLLAGAATLVAGPAMAQQAVEWDDGFDAETKTAKVATSPYPILSAQTVSGTERALQTYQGIVARGGWQQVPAASRFKVGVRHQAVTALKRRLIAGGDLDASVGDSPIFDSFTDVALKHFQQRHGLIADGVVRDVTLKALNITAEQRLRQLETNLVRIRSMSAVSGRFITLNIPGAELEAVENGQVVSRHNTVVGKPDRASPIISTRVVDINFNPFWTVPASIIRKDLIPKMQKEPDYLTVNKIRIFNKQGQELQPEQVNWNSYEATNYMFKQDPNDLNSLGSVRINIPNQHQVYMHDTPAKGLFGEDQRFHSSGCARVQNVRGLVAWILKDTPGWSVQHIDEVMRNGQRIDARPASAVPVYWVYVTGWATPDGIVQFRDDVYSRDGVGPIAQNG